MRPDLWHFKLHSGTKDDVWYDGYIKFKDLPEFLSNAVKDMRLWTKDRQHVDLRKLAKKVMFDCNIQVLCSCPAFQYWGPAYILSLRRYDGKYTDRETRPPRVRNPRQYGAICKHGQALLNAYPFYISTLAGFLRDYHGRQILYLEGEAKRTRVGYRRGAEELRRRKEEEEERRPPAEAPEERPEETEGEEEARESIVKEQDFRDVFQPITFEHWFKRLGGKINPNGTWTHGKFTFNPKPKYPILSRAYDPHTFAVEKLHVIPPRAKASKKVVEDLSKAGVRWKQFSYIRRFPLEGYSTNSGVQAVGSYKQLMVIYESKVGVEQASAGFLYWVGPRKSIQSADGATCTSSSDAFRKILRKMENLSSKK
jgi:hypothetical protein